MFHLEVQKAKPIIAFVAMDLRYELEFKDARPRKLRLLNGLRHIKQFVPARQTTDRKAAGNRRLKGMCRELYDHRDWLWTFVEVQGVEPTNNTAERALRPAVIYRKLSFRTQSESGSRFVERMLTMSETCRLQNRSVFDYLTTAVEAHFGGQTAPSLLPRA